VRCACVCKVQGQVDKSPSIILLGLVEHNSHHSANKLYLPLGHQMGALHVTHSSKSWFSLKENRVFTVPGGV